MSAIENVRALCLALPEAFELETWDHPTFRVGSRLGKIFCTATPDSSTVTVKADPVEREALLAHGEPFFTPAYVGSKGWIGVRTDHAKDVLSRLCMAHSATVDLPCSALETGLCAERPTHPVFAPRARKPLGRATPGNGTSATIALLLQAP